MAKKCRFANIPCKRKETNFYICTRCLQGKTLMEMQKLHQEQRHMCALLVLHESIEQGALSKEAFTELNDYFLKIYEEEITRVLGKHAKAFIKKHTR